MLKLLLGPDHKTLRLKTMELLREKTSAQCTGQYLIVPEQFSFEAEQLLCRMGGDCVSRFAEVLSLTRLAQRVESVYGGGARTWLDKGGRLLAAAQAVEQVHSALKYYAAVCRKTEFLEALLSVTDEFGGYGISSEQLITLSQRQDGQFAQKLQELALLYESYLSVCANARDSVGRLQNLRNVLAQQPFAEGCDFYLWGFTDFTALEREILEELILSANSVTLALPRELVLNEEVYPTAAATVRALEKFCNRQNIPLERVKINGLGSGPKEVLHVQKYVPHPTAVAFEGEASQVKLLRCHGIEEECRCAMLQVDALLEKGARFGDIAIACPRLEEYRNILLPVLRRSGVAFYLSGNRPITENAGCRMLLSALKAASENLEKESVLQYIKSGATGLSDDACSRLEKYVRMWNIGGSAWNREWTQHPRGLEQNWEERDRTELAKLNEWRMESLAPLTALRTELRSASGVGEMAHCLYRLAERISLAERMQLLADQLQAAGDYTRAQQYGQVYEILMDSLEQMALVMADATRTEEEFYRLLEKLLQQYSVGSVPAGVNEIVIGLPETFLGKSVPHLLVLDATDGVFPATHSGFALISEEERMVLISQGLSMAPLRVDAVDKELGNICSLFRSAEESIYISCPGENSSYIMEKIGRMFGGIDEAPARTIALDENELAALQLRGGQPPEKDTPIQAALRKKRSYQFGMLSRETTQKLYGKKLYLSASRIDRYSACRFSHFMRYGLKAEPDNPVSFNASAFGTFVHDVLEKTARDIMDMGGFGHVSLEKTLEIAILHMDAYEAEILTDMTSTGERFRYLFRRNRQEAAAVVADLWQELHRSDFVPVAFELEFSAHGQLNAVEVNGKNITGLISGFVDRVDAFEHEGQLYVRVVDYKTGGKDFDYADLTVGHGLQMLIYLFALRRNGKEFFGKEPIPAGVLYQPAREWLESFPQKPGRDAAAKKQMDKHARKGMVLRDDVVLEAMEPGVKDPCYLPIRRKGEEDWVGDLASYREMQELERFVFDKLAQMTDDICSGDIAPNPVVRGAENSACTYCDYRDSCQKDLCKPKERRLRKIGNREFFAEIMGKAVTEDE